MQYFNENEVNISKKKRNKLLIIYFCALFFYLALSVGNFVWYLTLPYGSGFVVTVRLIEYPLTAVFVIFSFIFFGIPYKRANSYYKLTVNLATGKKEENTASFFEYDQAVTVKDGVDMKSLVFLQWNEHKKDYFERRVLVFYDRPFPDLEEKQDVTFVTQGNVLISYESSEKNKG